jgi:hypothetical protein
MEKWLEQIKEVTVDYQKAVTKLENAQLDYEKRTKKWYNTILPFLLPLITVVVILLVFVIAVKFVGCPNPINLQFQGVEITQTCKE